MRQTVCRATGGQTRVRGWLAAIGADFDARVAGPVPPYVSNATRTLRVLYMLADRGVRPSWRGQDVLPLRHSDMIKVHVADVPAGVAPFTG